MAMEVNASLTYFQADPLSDGKPATPEIRLDYQGELGGYHSWQYLREGNEDVETLRTFLQTNKGYRANVVIDLKKPLVSRNVFRLDTRRITKLKRIIDSHNKGLTQN